MTREIYEKALHKFDICNVHFSPKEGLNIYHSFIWKRTEGNAQRLLKHDEPTHPQPVDKQLIRKK